MIDITARVLSVIGETERAARTLGSIAKCVAGFGLRIGDRLALEGLLIGLKHRHDQVFCELMRYGREYRLKLWVWQGEECHHFELIDSPIGLAISLCAIDALLDHYTSRRSPRSH